MSSSFRRIGSKQALGLGSRLGFMGMRGAGNPPPYSSQPPRPPDPDDWRRRLLIEREERLRISREETAAWCHNVRQQNRAAFKSEMEAFKSEMLTLFREFRLRYSAQSTQLPPPPPPATAEPYRYQYHQPSPPPAPTVPDPQQQHHYHQGEWYSKSQGYYQPSPPAFAFGSSTYSAQPYSQPHTHFNESQTNGLIYGPPPPSTYSAQPYPQPHTHFNESQTNSVIYGPPPLPFQTSYPSHLYSQPQQQQGGGYSNLYLYQTPSPPTPWGPPAQSNHSPTPPSFTQPVLNSQHFASHPNHQLPQSGPLPTPASYYAPPPPPSPHPPCVSRTHFAPVFPDQNPKMMSDPEIAKTQEERKRMAKQLASMNSVTYDAEFHGGTDKAYYVSSIPVENDVVRRMASYTAPKSLIHDMPRGGEEDEASASSKKIIDREDDYRRRRLNRNISQERHDPFAAGEKTPDPSVRTYAEIMREKALKSESEELEEDDVAGSESETTTGTDTDYDDEDDEVVLEDGMPPIQNENVPQIEKETHRLAVVNLDWRYVKAVDLFVVLRSFLPKGGEIKSVAVYPSDFGIERMKHEEIHGPVGLFDDKDKEGNIHICERPAVILGLDTAQTIALFPSRVVVSSKHDSLVGNDMINGLRVPLHVSPDEIRGVMLSTQKSTDSIQQTRVGEGYSSFLRLSPMFHLAVREVYQSAVRDSGNLIATDGWISVNDDVKCCTVHEQHEVHYSLLHTLPLSDGINIHATVPGCFLGGHYGDYCLVHYPGKDASSAETHMDAGYMKECYNEQELTEHPIRNTAAYPLYDDCYISIWVATVSSCLFHVLLFLMGISYQSTTAQGVSLPVAIVWNCLLIPGFEFICITPGQTHSLLSHASLHSAFCSGSFYVKMHGIGTSLSMWGLGSIITLLVYHIDNQLVGWHLVAKVFETPKDNALESWVAVTTKRGIDALTTPETSLIAIDDLTVTTTQGRGRKIMQLRSHYFELLEFVHSPKHSSPSTSSLLQLLSQRQAHVVLPFHYMLILLLVLLDTYVDCRYPAKLGSAETSTCTSIIKVPQKVNDSVAEGVLQCSAETLMQYLLVFGYQRLAVLMKLAYVPLFSSSDSSEEIPVGVHKCFRVLLQHFCACSATSWTCDYILETGPQSFVADRNSIVANEKQLQALTVLKVTDGEAEANPSAGPGFFPLMCNKNREVKTPISYSNILRGMHADLLMENGTILASVTMHFCSTTRHSTDEVIGATLVMFLAFELEDKLQCVKDFAFEKLEDKFH